MGLSISGDLHDNPHAKFQLAISMNSKENIKSSCIRQENAFDSFAYTEQGS